MHLRNLGCRGSRLDVLLVINNPGDIVTARALRGGKVALKIIRVRKSPTFLRALGPSKLPLPDPEKHAFGPRTTRGNMAPRIGRDSQKPKFTKTEICTINSMN